MLSLFLFGAPYDFNVLLMMWKWSVCFSRWFSSLARVRVEELLVAQNEKLLL